MSRKALLPHLVFSLCSATAIGVVVAFSVTLWVSDSAAYQFYSDDTNDVGGCGQCHGVFRSGKYVSEAENWEWASHLHAGHLNGTDIGGNCSTCHDGAGVSGRTVNLNSSGAAMDGSNYVSCSGCHGRFEDANTLGDGPGWGAGLRQHHNEAGAPADSNGEFCVTCHGDADPAAFTTASEDTMPPWYSSTTNDIVSLALEPCNADLEEEFSGDPLDLGLDNDGDLDYDLDDSDCAGATPTPTATPTITPTPTPTGTPTAEPTATPTSTPSVTPTATPSAIPTLLPTPTPTATPSATPSVTPSVTPSTTPTATPTTTPTVTPTPTPEPGLLLQLASGLLGLAVLDKRRRSAGR